MEIQLVSTQTYALVGSNTPPPHIVIILHPIVGGRQPIDAYWPECTLQYSPVR
jgi:hypothetical protein